MESSSDISLLFAFYIQVAPTNVKKHFGQRKFSSVKITGRGFHYVKNSVSRQTQFQPQGQVPLAVLTKV
jgi:hypothetical protein